MEGPPPSLPPTLPPPQLRIWVASPISAVQRAWVVHPEVRCTARHGRSNHRSSACCCSLSTLWSKEGTWVYPLSIYLNCLYNYLQQYYYRELRINRELNTRQPGQIPEVPRGYTLEKKKLKGGLTSKNSISKRPLPSKSMPPTLFPLIFCENAED